MNCTAVSRDRRLERYLSGELSEAEALELEEHCLTCAECLDTLQDLLALRSELAEDRWAVRERPLGARSQWRWAWLGAVAAGLLAIGLGLWLPSREAANDRRLEIARLAEIEPPPYTPRTLRGPREEAESLFDEAMAHYQEGRYGDAIPGLQAATRLDPSSARSLFYLGVCHLVTGLPAPAITHFDRVVELGRTPYLERARLYRAKALLRTGNLEGAREELQEVVRLGGDAAADAQRILDRLPG